MPLELRLAIVLGLAMVIVYSATPVAIKAAARFQFYDLPTGHKGHRTPTPYLGGAAVVSGFVVTLLALSDDWNQTVPVIAGVVLLWVVGTFDDRRTVSPAIRVLVEIGLATMLWASDLGWSLGLGAGVDLAMTAIWVVAVINAINLFDNMDGAASTMALAVSGSLAVLGVVQGDVWVTVAAGALCGSCAGFLPHNLARPSARIFLGDGGSMPLGFAIAAIVLIGARSAAGEVQGLLMGLLLVGVLAVDTALVVISRTRRGVSFLTGGQDHLTHRARGRLHDTRAVAATLGAAQVVLSLLALLAEGQGSTLLFGTVVVYLILAGTAIAVLDRTTQPSEDVADMAIAQAPPPGRARRSIAPLLLVPVGVALGVSPFVDGGYDSAEWAPAGILVLALLAGCCIARTPHLTRRAVAVLVAISALATWSLMSSLWADSIQQAVLEGNRLVVYAALLATLLMVLRRDVAVLWLAGAILAGALAVATWTMVGLWDGDAEMFLGGRLNDPLGYINGQASFFVLAMWLSVGLAEQRRSVTLAGLGAGLAVLFAGLAVLGQSRGAILAAAISVVFVLVVMPGRQRRLVLLAAGAACLGPAVPRLLDVYSDRGASDSLPGAATAITIAAIAAAVVWTLLVLFERRVAAAERTPVARKATSALLAVVAVAALAFGAARAEPITDYVDRQYDAFVNLGGGQGEPTASRLATGAGNRYDYWRIAVNVWRDDSAIGVGAGGYDQPYFLRRETQEDIRQAHSLPLQILSELGIVGALLLVLILAAGAWAAGGRLLSLHRSGERAPVLVAALGVLSAWSIHTSVDWMHLLPGVTGIAIAAMAVVLRRPPADTTPRLRKSLDRRRPVVQAAGALAIGLVLTLAGLSLGRQALAEHYRSEAQQALADDPAEALRQANRALRLDREDLPAYYAKAAAIARFGDGQAAEDVLRQATRKEPDDFVTWVLLGDLAVRRDNIPAARGFYGRAAELNPQDTGVAALARDPRTARDR